MAGDKPGVKVDDYWEVGKAQLQDPTKFLDSLFKYDKVSMIKFNTIQVTGVYMCMRGAHALLMYRNKMGKRCICADIHLRMRSFFVVYIFAFGLCHK